MTCWMSPSKRALLAQREVAVTVGYWLARNDAKNSRFFRGSGRRRKHDTHPADARMHRVCQEGSWEGGGVLLARVAALFLGEGTRRVTMEIAPWCGAIYYVFSRGGSIFTTWGRQTTGFRDVVAHPSNTPVQLCCQNRDHIVSSSRNISHRGQF